MVEARRRILLGRGTIETRSLAASATVEQGRPGLPPTDPANGLMETEAQQRRAQGLGHRTRRATSRTYWQIVRENLFTFFNITLIGIGVLLIGLGLTTDALVSSGLAVINAVVGIIQEAIAKRRLDKIALVARVRATVVRDGEEREVDPEALVLGDVLVLRPGDQVMLDGRVVGDGRIEVDESLLTGESDPVSRQPGDPVFSGSYTVSGSARYQAEKVGDQTMASQITAGARVYRRIITPLQRQINLIVRLLLAIAGTFAVMLLIFSAVWDFPIREIALAAAVILGIVPAGLFLMVTVTYAMAAIRLANRDALIQQMNAVESLSHVNVFCMDKTGTLTANSLEVVEFRLLAGDGLEIRTALGAMVRSASAQNPTSEAIAAACDGPVVPLLDEIPFSSARKWGAVAFDRADVRGVVALGAPELLGRHVAGDMEDFPAGWTDRGLRVLLVASSPTPTMLHDGDGVPTLPPDLAARAWLGIADELRPNSRETLAGFRDAGIDLKIISGDNPETVAALAHHAGMTGELTLFTGPELAESDDERFDQIAEEGRIFGRVTAEQKERLIDALRRRGHYVAMTGDGVNDVLALKKANLGIAMQSGSQATRAAADIVLLNDSFGALPDAFREGQRVRMGLQGALGLFLTRAFVAALVILLVILVQAGFPFSPTSLSLLTTLTVGIPATGLALWAHPATPPRGLLQTLVAFVLPAALTLAAAAFVVYTLYYFSNVDADFSTIPIAGVPDATAGSADAIARDALTHLLVLAGLVLVPFTSPPTSWFAVAAETNHDWRPTLLAVAMLPVYIAILAIRPLREFFGTDLLSAADYIVIGAVVVVWAIVLRYAYRTQAFGRYFGYASAP